MPAANWKARRSARAADARRPRPVIPQPAGTSTAGDWVTLKWFMAFVAVMLAVMLAALAVTLVRS